MSAVLVASPRVAGSGSPDFTISTNPSSVTFYNGDSGTSTVTVASLNGFSGIVTLTPSIVPGWGFTYIGQFYPYSKNVTLSPGGTANATVFFSTSSANRTDIYTVTINGSSGSLSHSATVTITGNNPCAGPPTGDFSISESASFLSIPVGSERQSRVVVKDTGGFCGWVKLVATPSSSSLGCWFTTLTNTASLSLEGDFSNYQWPTCTGNQAGAYTLTVTGTSGSYSHSVVVQVNATDYNITGPATTSFNAGSSKTYGITATSLAGFSGIVTLRTKSPTNLSVACPTDVSLTSGSSTTLSCDLDSPTASVYNFNITASYACTDCYYNAVDTKTVSAQVTVNGPSVPGFLLQAIPASVVQTPGSPVSSTIEITSVNGFAGSVSLSSVVSTGLVSSISPSSVNLSTGGSVNATLTATSTNCGLGGYLARATGTSSFLSFSTNAQIGLKPPSRYAYFVLCADPLSITSTPGATSNVTITLVGGNGWGAPVTVSSFIYPNTSSVSCSLQTVVVNLVSTATDILGCSSSVTGSFNVTVTGSWSVGDCHDCGPPNYWNWQATIQYLVLSPTPSPLTAGISYNPPSPQTGYGVTFAGSAIGGTPPYTYSWSFGDGGTASGLQVSHTYSTGGSYTVGLTVMDNESPQKTATAQKTVTVVNPPPPSPPPLTASYTFSPSSPQTGHAITFTSSISGGTPPYKATWSFGDATQATGLFLTHTYSYPGTYTVFLYASDSGSPAQNVNSQQLITVTSPPPPPPTGYILSWQGYDWDGGHEESVYLNGQLLASLPPTSVSSNGGAWASFSLNITSSVVPGSNTLTFTHANWDCGTVDSVRNLQVTSKTAIVYTNSSMEPLSCTQKLTYVFNANPTPTPLSASFTFSPPSPSTYFTFTAQASGGFQPYTYTWDFGDGHNCACGYQVLHNYQAAGTYTVTLTVTDSASSNPQPVTVTHTVTVPNPPPPPLSAGFSFTPSNPTTGQTITFAGTASGGVSPYSYSWNFGDGSTSSGASVSYSYSKAGTYSVTLAVTDSASPMQTTGVTRSVVVSSPPPSLTASFTVSPTAPIVGQSATFSGSASGGVAPYMYSWNFGDGATGSGSTVSHTYTAAGNYNVVLTVQDSATPSPSSVSVTHAVAVATPPSSGTYTLSWQGYDWDGGGETTVTLNGHVVAKLPVTDTSVNGGVWASFSIDITSFVVKGTNALTFTHANWDCGTSDNVRNLQITSGTSVVYSNPSVAPLSCTQTLTYTFTV